MDNLEALYFSEKKPDPLAPLRRLACAVILRALKEAREGDAGARQWLESGEGLSFWCTLLEVPPEKARPHLLEELEHEPPDPEDLIRNELSRHPEKSNRQIGRELGVGYEKVRQIRRELP